MIVRIAASVDTDTMDVQYLVEPARALFDDPDAFADAIDALAAKLNEDAPARRRMSEAAKGIDHG